MVADRFGEDCHGLQEVGDLARHIEAAKDDHEGPDLVIRRCCHHPRIGAGGHQRITGHLQCGGLVLSEG
jgi:hypothetical protein